MDKQRDVPSTSGTGNEAGVSVHSSSASESGIYTSEMAWMKSWLKREPLTSDLNEIT